MLAQARLLVIAISLFVFGSVFIACGGSNSDNAIVTQVIGAEGGTISSADGLARLEIPAGALSEQTEISLRREPSSVASLLLYEFGPAGLEFTSPALLLVDVGGIVPNSDTSNLVANSFPVIVTTSRDGQQAEALANQQLSLDADTNTTLLQGEVEHFSRFAVGGNLNVKAGIDNVPQFWPANTDFGPVVVTVENGSNVENINGPRLDTITYRDQSIVQVIFRGESNPILLTPSPEINTTRSYNINYACGDPGVGTFKTTLTFVGIGSRMETYYTPEEINVAAAFIFSPDAITGGESQTRLSTTLEFYKLMGTRLVNCGGSTPVSEVSESTASTGSEQSTQTSEDTSDSSQDSPIITTSTSNISIDHTMGGTQCPTVGSVVTIETEDSNDLDIAISEDLSFLEVSPGGGTTLNGQFQFDPIFPCSGFQIGANQGSIAVTAVDPSTGLSSNTIVIPVTVTVN